MTAPTTPEDAALILSRLDDGELASWAQSHAADLIRELQAECARLREDAGRLAAMAEFDGVCLTNKFCVQARLDGHGKSWSTVYYADPPNGVPKYKAASKLDALREAIDAALRGKETP
jgi:hypothetical protein